MNDRLNRVVWSALSSRQSRISKGGSLARRFDPEISPFAASKDNSAAALNALAALIGRNEAPVFLLQAEQILLPDTLVAEKTALGVLMTERVAKTATSHEFEISVLSDDDVPDMLALAELTKPGPFTSRTPELGTFLGVKLDGRLAAMGGTRLNLEGYTEISGLCTHPDYQGRGLASALTLQIAADIRGRGDTPFLHAYADNHGAIALYRNLGFEIWSEVNVAVVSRKS